MIVGSAVRRLPWILMTVFGTAILCSAIGCNRPSAASAPEQSSAKAATEPAVSVVRPERKTLSHRIEQPGFNIEAFQETPLFPRISGYIRSWNADIGDHVHKGQLLAELHVPEMVVDLQQKEAAVRYANAQIAQARAALLTAQAQLERSRSQYERLARAGKGGILDPESVDETRLGYEAAKAGVEKAKADVAAMEAQLGVAEANRDYSRTMLQYTQILAPYDGVVTQRSISTWDFVQPAGTGTKGLPLYTVDQIDPVRVFVNVPGADAPWIKDGDTVSLRLQGAGGEQFVGNVTRNARSLDARARTLRTEIDLPNPQGKLLPGMYVQATITVQHANVWTLPAAAVLTEGDQTFCYRVENGKAVRTPLQVGLRGGGLVEVLKKQLPAASPGAEGRWEAITGDEEIAASDVATLSDGQPIRTSLQTK
jgi:multidrug efflux pump subunit AcrA (membrane-fusion protein)